MSTSVDTTPDYDEEKYDRAKWMLCHTPNPSNIRFRIIDCETLPEVQGWVAAYNEVCDQLPPGKQDIIEDIQAQADKIREDRVRGRDR